MKRLFITLLVVVIGSLTMLGQTLSIMKIGEEILSKNNFLSAKQIIKSNKMDILKNNQTQLTASLMENGFNSICICDVLAFSKTNKHIKLVRFIIIAKNKDGIIPETGAYVIQSEYSKDTYHCIVRHAPSDGTFEIRLERKK